MINNHHIINIQQPPFVIGDHVRIIEDGPHGETFIIVGARYEYRAVAYQGWNYHVATPEDVEKGYGGIDAFGPEHLELVRT